MYNTKCNIKQKKIINMLSKMCVYDRMINVNEDTKNRENVKLEGFKGMGVMIYDIRNSE